MRLPRVLVLLTLFFVGQRLPAPTDNLITALLTGQDLAAFQTPLTALVPDPAARTEFLKLVAATREVSKATGMTPEQAVGHIFQAANPFYFPRESAAANNRLRLTLEKIFGSDPGFRFKLLPHDATYGERAKNSTPAQKQGFRAFVQVMNPAFLETRPSAAMLHEIVPALLDERFFIPLNAPTNAGRHVLRDELRQMMTTALGGDQSQHDAAWKIMTQNFRDPSIKYENPFKPFLTEERMTDEVARYFRKFGDTPDFDPVGRLTDVKNLGFNSDRVLAGVIEKTENTVNRKDRITSTIGLNRYEEKANFPGKADFSPSRGSLLSLNSFTRSHYCPIRNYQIVKSRFPQHQ